MLKEKITNERTNDNMSVPKPGAFFHAILDGKKDGDPAKDVSIDDFFVKDKKRKLKDDDGDINEEEMLAAISTIEKRFIFWREKKRRINEKIVETMKLLNSTRKKEEKLKKQLKSIVEEEENRPQNTCPKCGLDLDSGAQCDGCFILENDLPEIKK
ncbi:MAG: hypothetical protein DRM99_05590 [Thermoplasmata archaeon]|nr:MAG: hypothetical protein DRM99_05590 [Thermoplasmata archaeon]